MNRCRALACVLPILTLPLLTGCLATYGQAAVEQEAALRQDMALLQEQNRRLEGRLEGMELEIERVSRAVDQLRATPGGPSVAEVQALQSRIALLEGQLRGLDAAREKDRQEIINSLSSKLTQIVGPASSGRAKPAASQNRRSSGPQEGYEHTVESGQTLSAIAAAYGVSTKSIVDANNLARPDQLRVGQKLFIPAP